MAINKVSTPMPWLLTWKQSHKLPHVHCKHVNAGKDHSNDIPFLDLFGRQHNVHWVPIPTSVNKKNIEGLLFLLFKNNRDLVDILCITYKYIFHISNFIFDLNAVNEPARLYSDGNFAQRLAAPYVTDSRP